MDGKILFRIAKPADAKQIADVQFSVRDKHPLGIFSRMDRCFLAQYYKIILNDPYEVVICAENSNKEIVGFNSATLDAAHQMKTLRKHIISLGFAAIPSIIKSPTLFKELIKRFNSTSEKSNEKFVYAEGPRGEYWAWKPNAPNSLGAIDLSLKSNQLMAVLGVTHIYIEVDIDNKNVLAYHKAMKAEVEQIITLPDGRKRALLKKPVKLK